MYSDKLRIKEILIGIRHKRNFSILDKFGEIVDDIVDNPSTGFPKGYFDAVSSEGFTKVITNEKTKNNIKFTQFDLIYSYNFNNDMDSNVETKKFFERLNNYIVPSIIEKYNIRDFSRIGIVYTFEFLDKKDYERSLKNIVNNNFSNVNSIRFSEKDTTEKGRLYKETNDYINKLYSLNINNDIAIFSYDFQYYFSPLKSIFKQCEVEKIIEKSQLELKSDIFKLIGEENEEKVQQD